jgi:hypothetical protein
MKDITYNTQVVPYCYFRNEKVFRLDNLYGSVRKDNMKDYWSTNPIIYT